MSPAQASVSRQAPYTAVRLGTALSLPALKLHLTQKPHQNQAPRRPWESAEEGDKPLLPAATLALWLICGAVGAVGLIFPYQRPHASPRPFFPPPSEAIQVELANGSFAPPAEAAQQLSPELLPPPPPDLALAPAPPPIVAVVPLGAQIAFELPVNTPVRVVEPGPSVQSSPIPAIDQTLKQEIAPVALTYGQGEGKQPAPDYPRAAMRAGQEGTILVRLEVGEFGRVTRADAASPSPWPLLNDAALRAVRERWRFRAGAPRVYEVSIRFELKK